MAEVTAAIPAEVSGTDCTDRTAKLLVRADPAGALAAALDVPFGRAVRDGDGALVARTAPDAWLLLAAGPATPLVRRIEALGAGEFASVVDVTHGHALVRLTGTAAAAVLAKLCAIDLADPATPDGTAFRSLVAGVPATVIHDARPDTGPDRSYLVQCDRSYRQYLREVLTDAGDEFGLAWT